MEHQVEITFRSMGRSPAMEQRVRKRVEKLDQWFDDLQSCRVVIEADHRHHHKGNLYHVRVVAVVPGAELVVGRDPREHHAHEDAYVAIRDAFDAITRQLEDWARKRRADVKHHDTPQHGVIGALFPDHGIITTAEGRTVDFHAHSVVDHDFASIKVGDPVRFAEVEDLNGPRASTVHVVGKHHILG